MVFYSLRAKQDLKYIFSGLLSWSKHPLEYNHVVSYHNEILSKCDVLDSLTFHFNSRLSTSVTVKKFIPIDEAKIQSGILFIIWINMGMCIFNELYQTITLLQNHSNLQQLPTDF